MMAVDALKATPALAPTARGAPPASPALHDLWPRAEVERREAHLRARLEAMVRAAGISSLPAGLCRVCGMHSDGLLDGLNGAPDGRGWVAELFELSRTNLDRRLEPAMAMGQHLPELLRPSVNEMGAALGLHRSAEARADLLRLNIGPAIFSNHCLRWIVRHALMEVECPRAQDVACCPWCAAEHTGVGFTFGGWVHRGFGWDRGGWPSTADDAIAAVRSLARESGGAVVIDVLRWGIAALEGGARLGEVRAGVEEAMDLFTPYVRRRSPAGVRRYFGLWLEGVMGSELSTKGAK